MLPDVTFDIAELVREDKGLAIFPQRLPPILAQRMDRHGEETELHWPCSTSSLDLLPRAVGVRRPEHRVQRRNCVQNSIIVDMIGPLAQSRARKRFKVHADVIGVR